MEPDLSDSIERLASTITSLRASAAPEDEARISELEDKLAKLKVAAIVADLHREQAEYEAALAGVEEAISQAKDVISGIARVKAAIDAASQAVALIDKALSVAAI